MRKLNPGGLACFSPPVMLATFLIEVALALFVVWRYKINRLTQLAILMLVFLAIFQFAEYNVCELNFGWSQLTWSKIGYVAITMLPPLGVHVAYELVGAKKRSLLPWAYGAAAGFIIFFLFIGQSLTGRACLGNYVIFTQAPGSVWLYALYYYGLIATGIGLSWRFAKERTGPISRALYGLVVGYLAFLLPTATINIVDHSTVAGIPSIMCGFAIIYALILVVWILPAAAKLRH